ncbi:MAG TPA: SDR family oxidoreductase [Bacteroidales bacterium]|nr:SDR family oxidoreductase [Bacteroidales bacterium]
MSKTALITGASGGIGYQFAMIHAEHGDNLVLVARSKDKLDEIKCELETRYKILVHTIGMDLALPEAARYVYDELKNNNIPVDYLINNAGLGDVKHFADSDWSKQEKMINLNITALTHLTWLFLPDMIKRGSGRILNVASTASFQPGPTMSVYFASKAFVLSFSEAIGSEVAEKGITVTALCPGSTESGFHLVAMDGQEERRKRILPSARKIAEFGYNAMMKGKSVAIPGLKNKFLATSVRFVPRSLVVNLARRIEEKKH